MMSRSDFTNMYTMEELVPVVGLLVGEFTSKESSSVTFERARQLMEAVIYCISHLECKENGLMDAIITMDYPICKMDWNLKGIDRIQQYVDAIWEEQSYLMKLPRDEVIDILRAFHPRYEREFFNLWEVVTAAAKR